MLSSFHFWLRGLKTPIQAFGKLPFYNDYLRWISSSASDGWRSWILANYPEKVPLVNRASPFIFVPAVEASIAVGQIEPSNDGTRDFPFSLFIILNRGIQKSRFIDKIIPCIWDSIGQARNEIDHCRNVEQFNHLIQKKVVVVKKAGLSEKTSFQTNQIWIECRSNNQPKLFVF